ncbi:hypothetical protein Pve01_34290 [Planomonospora venezuelensis]|nr:hypothetical protein Pve01_34290 [Planomonospora venezuelensis]
MAHTVEDETVEPFDGLMKNRGSETDAGARQQAGELAGTAGDRRHGSSCGAPTTARRSRERYMR